MVKLLERQVELQEEQNELIRENSQLLAEVLSKLDTIANKETVINVGSGGTNLAANHTSVKNILAEDKKDRGPAPEPDSMLLEKTIYGTNDPNEIDFKTQFEVEHFWPTGKANPGWVRASVKHPNEGSLHGRIAKGCLCGKPIVLKENNGDKFYSCEALTQRGSCPYRPAAYFDKLTFLANLPPKK